MTSYVYTSAIWKLLNGDLDLGAGTFAVSLHTSAYTPDVDAHEFFDDLSGETSGDGIPDPRHCPLDGSIGHSASVHTQPRTG